MRHENLIRKILFTLGVCLLTAAIVLGVVSVSKLSRIHVNIDAALDFLETVIPDAAAGIKESRLNNSMPSVVYDGQDYSAILSISRLSVKLPIRSSWDRTAVKKVPCRYSGSLYDGTLVIGGTDAEGRFDFISEVDIGDVITVTDMKGYVFTYKVITVKHAKNAKKQTLIDPDYDLVLFARDRTTGDWLLVKCRVK